MRVWSLRRLHAGVGLGRRVLVLILVLVGRIRWHLRITRSLRRRHLLVIGVWSISLSHLLHAWTTRGNQGSSTGVGNRAWAVIEWSIWRLPVAVGGSGSSRWVVGTGFLVVLVPVLGRLVLATPHPHVASDAHAAALLSDHAAQRRALGQTRELLRGEDGEGSRLDLGTVGDEVVAVEDDIGVFGVQVLDLAQVLEEGEAEPVLALVADRQIGEDEVARGRGTVEVGHASDRRARQDGEAGRGGRRAAGGDGAGILEAGVEEEVGIVGEGDLGVVLEDAQFDDRGWIDGAAVSTGFGAAATGSSALGLLDDLEVVADLAAVLGGADRRALSLVADGNGRGHGEQRHSGTLGELGCGWVLARVSNRVFGRRSTQHKGRRQTGQTGCATTASEAQQKACTARARRAGRGTKAD